MDSGSLDLRPLCLWCGKDMWPCRVTKMYCSQRCIKAHYKHLEHVAKAEALADRQCLHCGKAMPPSMKRDAVYCSQRCASDAWWKRHPDYRRAKG